MSDDEINPDENDDEDDDEENNDDEAVEEIGDMVRNLIESVNESTVDPFPETSGLIKELLLEKCGCLDLDEVDNVIYLVCLDDIYYFLQFFRRNHMEENPDFNDCFTVSVLGRKLREDFTPDLQKYEEYKEKIKKYAEFLVNEWWNKYQVRTKIVFQQPEQQGFVNLALYFTGEEWKNAQDYLRDILFKNGERCFVSVLIDQSVRAYLQSRGKEKPIPHTPDERIRLLEEIGEELKRACRIDGALIMMYPNLKDVNRFRVREWRNTDSNSAIK